MKVFSFLTFFSFQIILTKQQDLLSGTTHECFHLNLHLQLMIST